MMAAGAVRLGWSVHNASAVHSPLLAPLVRLFHTIHTPYFIYEAYLT